MMVRFYEFSDFNLDEDLVMALDTKKKQLDNQAKVIDNRKKALANQKARDANRDAVAKVASKPNNKTNKNLPVWQNQALAEV